ncbi:MAG: hypothetical protein ACC652_07215, partial [Acidimicrobiales bacterium]
LIKVGSSDIGGAAPAVNNWTRRILGWGALFGALISLRHLYIQNVDAGGVSCSPDAPCSAKWVDEFGGVVSIPYMAMSGFLLIAALCLLTYFRHPSDAIDVAPPSRINATKKPVEDSS